MNRYKRHNTVRLSVAFLNSSGVAANPTTVRLRLLDPAGKLTLYTSANGVANPSTGAFTYDLDLTGAKPGEWKYAWESESFTAGDDGAFLVDSSVTLT